VHDTVTAFHEAVDNQQAGADPQAGDGESHGSCINAVVTVIGFVSEAVDGRLAAIVDVDE
jgi:hypothetical protein